MQHRTAVALLVALASLVVACGGGSSTPAPTGQTVEGRTFLSTRVDGRTLVAGSVIRITFANGSLSATAGCNTMSGPYRIDRSTLVVAQLSTTEMGCAQDLMAQDQWVAGLLNGATMTLDGNTLTLAANGVQVSFLDRVVADPDRPLVGTRWVVDGVIRGGTVSSVPAGLVASFTIANGMVSIEGGCNTGGGSVQITDTTIAFGPIGMTKKACPPPASVVELAVTQVASGTISYRIQAGTLTLDAGGVGLTLKAAP